MSEEENKNQQTVGRETIDQKPLDILAKDSPEVEQDNLLAKKEIAQAFKALHHEIDFASRALNIKSGDFANTLNNSISSLQHLLSSLESLNKQMDGQNKAMIDELNTLTILPSKIAESVQSIVPEIANRVEKIHNHRILEIKDQFTLLHNQLANSIGDYEVKLKNISSQSLSKLSETTEKFSATIEQKLIQYSNQLAKEADAVGSQKSMRFLGNIALVVLFSGLVSTLTSYLVATQFPRYVTVDSPNSLSITDSKVQVWEARIPGKTNKLGK